MDFTPFLPDDAKVEETRQQLYTVRRVLVAAMHEYAELSLDAANEALQIAKDSGPVVATFTPRQRYQMYKGMCQEAMQASMIVNQGILNLEETTNPTVDTKNQEYKSDTMRLPQVNAMIEGANNRMTLAQATYPDNPTPGKLCNGSVLFTEPGKGT